MEIRITVDDTTAREAFRRSPAVMSAHMERSLSRAANEVARSAKSIAPKAFSNLTNSIRAFRVAPLHWRVSPGVNYAQMVEQGTRPHFPPPAALQPWVERVLGLRGDEAESASWRIARAISRRGTTAKPYMEPTVTRMRSRVVQLLRDGVDSGLREAFR